MFCSVKKVNVYTSCISNKSRINIIKYSLGLLNTSLSTQRAGHKRVAFINPISNPQKKIPSNHDTKSKRLDYLQTQKISDSGAKYFFDMEWFTEDFIEILQCLNCIFAHGPTQ